MITCYATDLVGTLEFIDALRDGEWHQRECGHIIDLGGQGEYLTVDTIVCGTAPVVELDVLIENEIELLYLIEVTFAQLRSEPHALAPPEWGFLPMRVVVGRRLEFVIQVDDLLGLYHPLVHYLDHLTYLTYVNYPRIYLEEVIYSGCPNILLIVLLN